MLSTVFAFAAVVCVATAQSLRAITISQEQSFAPAAIPSTQAYQNPFTMYLTMTNSWGVVTGMPSVVTSQPAVVTTQPVVATVAAGLETLSAMETGAAIPSTAGQSGIMNLPSSMSTVVSRTTPSDQTPTTGAASSSTRDSPSQQSTGAAAQLRAGGALLGAAALAVVAL